MHNQSDRKGVAYTGGSTSNKPGRLAKIKKGDYSTLAEVNAAHQDWVRTHNMTPSNGEGMNGRSPNEVYAQKLREKRTAPRELLDLLLLRKHGPVKVGKNGVRWCGLHFGQYDLGLLQGKEVYLRIDDRDLSKVSVWDLEDRHFLGLARANRVIPEGADRELLRAAIREQRHNSKALRNAQPARLRIHEYLPDTMTRLRREGIERLAASRPPVPTPTPTLVPIRSPLEGELPKLQRAVEALKPHAVEKSEFSVERMLEIYETDAEGRETARLKQKSQWDLIGEYLEQNRENEAEAAPVQFHYESPFRRKAGGDAA
jgi:hypothetical protein